MPRGVVSRLPDRACALPECGTTFTPTKRQHAYCCQTHRLQAHQDQRFKDRLCQEIADGRIRVLPVGRRRGLRVKAVQISLL